MALRVCNSILRKSIRFSYNGHVNLPLEIAIPFPETGGVLRRPRVNGQIVTHFSPVCLISSEAVLTKLPKDKATETHDSTCHNPASILPNCGNQSSVLANNPNQPENKKVLKVAIIGAPNAGKSSLSNQLLGRKVFAVSKKVHTTRTQARGILNEDNIQIILLDTPGLTTPSKVKRHQLEKSLLVDPWNSVQEADLVLVLVDVSEKWTRDALDSEVLRVLAQNPDIPSVLVLNKVDLLKNKSMLLDITAGLTEGTVNGKKLRVRSVGKPLSEGRGKGAAVEPATLSPREQQTEAFNTLQNTAVDATTEGLSKNNLKQLRPRQGWPHFLDVFMLSALDAEEVEALKRYLVVEAKPGSWQYHSGVLTDQSPQEICTNSVREKLLELLPQEVPYTVSQTIEMWQEGERGDLDILIKLHVKKESHMKMLIGQGGQTISRIAREASEDLMNVFLCDVKLKLTVKIKK